MYHSEGARGRYEFVTRHKEPLDAADGLVAVRETILNIAAKHGFKATLAPRLQLDNCERPVFEEPTC